METSLHRALKSFYAGDTAQTEVVLDKLSHRRHQRRAA